MLKYHWWHALSRLIYGSIANDILNEKNVYGDVSCGDNGVLCENICVIFFCQESICYDSYRWPRAQTIQVWTGKLYRTMIKTIKHKTSISVGRLGGTKVHLSRPETLWFLTWTHCAANRKGQRSWMLWSDDYFSYFYWLNHLGLAKFRHGVFPDHVSFCRN